MGGLFAKTFHLCIGVILGFSVARVQATPLDEAIELRHRGEFQKAVQVLNTYLDATSSSLPAEERRAVEFEIERIRRIRQDYTLTDQQVFERIRKRVPSFTLEEFQKLERDGHFDVQIIDGQKRFVNTSVSNIFLRVPELRKRDAAYKPDLTYRKLYNTMQLARQAHAMSGDFLVLPTDFAVTYTLTVKPNVVTDGALVRCWLPYVRMFPFQSDAYLLWSEPAKPLLAPPEAPHRTVYLEKRARRDEPTSFSIHFIYRCWARVSSVDPAMVQPYRTDGPDYAYYTADRKPHLDLQNELLVKLNREIVGDEKNPYLVARKIYDWIANNTIYQYAREYSTLDNISYYTASRRAGDCGQHGMLFIALCRMNGIPARWQSGWESFELKGNNMHDWCEFYVEPYGWLPVDPDMAVNVVHYASDVLTSTESQELVDFMFGSMDQYRLATNSDFGAPLFPPKQDFRSETVDFQRGEVEADGKNLYFDKWSWKMDIVPISAEESLALSRKFIPVTSAPSALALANENRTDRQTSSPMGATAIDKPAPASAAGASR
ncbi:MAG: transglutaminase-like domain-containing protein [Candidatus Sumerlaeaceae bacterium]